MHTITGTIRDIAFEQISGDYYWGRYGDFKVIINKSTGYINATHLCGLAKNKNSTKKEFKLWQRTDSAKEILTIVAQSLRTTADMLIVVPTGLPNKLRGTYVHIELITHIAAWASPAFAAAVMKVVTKYLLDRDISRQSALVAGCSDNFAEQLHARASCRDDLTLASLPADRRIGCVYFVCLREFTKIGYTYNLPKRMSSLQSANPYTLTQVHTIITEYPELVERDLHVLFADCRGSGEWFQLPAGAIDRVKALYSE